jgi:hypothetical protein
MGRVDRQPAFCRFARVSDDSKGACVVQLCISR